MLMQDFGWFMFRIRNVYVIIMILEIFRAVKIWFVMF
jgi:hypothetical protein